MNLVLCTVHNERFAFPSSHVVKVSSMDHFIPDAFCLSPFIGWVSHDHSLKPVVDGGLLLFDTSMTHHALSRILLVNAGKIHIGLLAENIVTRVGAPHMGTDVSSEMAKNQFHNLVDKTICVDDEVIHMIGGGRLQKAVQASFFKSPSSSL